MVVVVVVVVVVVQVLEAIARIVRNKAWSNHAILVIDGGSEHDAHLCRMRNW